LSNNLEYTLYFVRGCNQRKNLEMLTVSVRNLQQFGR